MKLLITLSIFSLSVFSQTHCLSNQADYNLCYVELDLIRPTQAAVGLFTIKDKSGKIEKEWAQAELDEYLIEERNPAIISPDGYFYIIDGHHHNYSIATANIPKGMKKSFLKIKADFRGSSHAEFVEYMKDNAYTYLKDENFKDIDFSQLPKSIEALKDNPHRSLAWIVRERDCYKKTKTPFAEFFWGEYFFRNGVKIDSSLKPIQMQAAIEKAMKLCDSSSASILPGYKH